MAAITPSRHTRDWLTSLYYVNHSIYYALLWSRGRGAKRRCLYVAQAGIMKLKVAASFSHLASGASPYNSCHAHERNNKQLNTSLLIVGFRLYYPKVSNIPYIATVKFPVLLYEVSLLKFRHTFEAFCSLLLRFSVSLHSGFIRV